MRWDRLPNPWIHAALAVILSLLFVVFTYGGDAFRRGSLLFSGVLHWVEWPAATARRTLSTGLTWFEDQQELLRVNRMLRLEVLELRGRAQESVENVEPELPAGLLRARVTYRPPERWWEEVRVDRGSLDGVRPGDAVLSDGFLVGRVMKVASRECWVELLTSLSLLVPVVVDATRDLGVVTGTGAGGVQLLYIPPERELEEGMTLSTALVSERLQPGIPLGKIGRRDVSRGALFPYEVLLGADLSRLYNVSLFVRKGEKSP